MPVFRRQPIITNVSVRGLGLEVKRTLGKRRVKEKVALEAAEKLRPTVSARADSHYRHALQNLRTHLVTGPRSVGGVKSFTVHSPSGGSETIQTPPWAPLSARYLKSKKKMPGKWQYWRREDNLFPALRETIIEGSGAHVSSLRFIPGQATGGTFRRLFQRLTGSLGVPAQVEYLLQFQAQDPLLDRLLRESFVAGEPMKITYRFSNDWRGLDKSTGKEDDRHLLKVQFFESGPDPLQPRLYRPMLGHIMAAHGRLLHQFLRSI